MDCKCKDPVHRRIKELIAGDERDYNRLDENNKFLLLFKKMTKVLDLYNEFYFDFRPKYLKFRDDVNVYDGGGTPSYPLPLPDMFKFSDNLKDPLSPDPVMKDFTALMDAQSIFLCNSECCAKKHKEARAALKKVANTMKDLCDIREKKLRKSDSIISNLAKETELTEYQINAWNDFRAIFNIESKERVSFMDIGLQCCGLYFRTKLLAIVRELEKIHTSEWDKGNKNKYDINPASVSDFLISIIKNVLYRGEGEKEFSNNLADTLITILEKYETLTKEPNSTDNQRLVQALAKIRL